ncbi:MAG: hypothetical protein ACLFSH_10005 [Phormidium sp.]
MKRIDACGRWWVRSPTRGVTAMSGESPIHLLSILSLRRRRYSTLGDRPSLEIQSLEFIGN